ncbi:MAG: lyase family protein, partial [Porticoccaceae bacterium]|nr:lyase family protein [Porticoccaceae bacterium]
MHVSALSRLQQELLPALNVLHDALAQKALEFQSLIKIGRTHLMDAAPITLGQEFSGYVSQIDYARTQISATQTSLKMLALGGSAVGTGLNTPETWAADVASKISQLSGIDFCSAPNKFMASSAHDALVDLHGRLRLLATALFKIANDLRLLGSGPRCGLGELLLPANEPGSSIMPGKVNPTQTEALTMIAAQVMGNDTTIGVAGSQGHLELNVFKPVIIHNLLESLNLLSDGMQSFAKNCIEGLQANEEQLARNVDRSLMLVTALSPVIGYDKAATAAKLALEKNLSIKAAILELNFLSANEVDQLIDPALMLSPGN